MPYAIGVSAFEVFITSSLLFFRYEHTVRYYGYYSYKSRRMRKKAGMDDAIPAVLPDEMSSREFRQNWARLIQKIYEVDPPEQEPLHIPELLYDYSDSQIPAVGYWS